MIIDTHAHIYWDSFQEDYSEVISRAKSAGVTKFINIGVDLDTSQKAAQLQSDQIQFFSSIGIHPHEEIKYFQNTDVSIHKDIAELKSIFNNNPGKVVAVGECGLDFFFENNPDSPSTSLSEDNIKDLQRKLFKAQLELAREIDLPLSIHCRDDRSKDPGNSECWEACLEMIKDSFGVLHCYSGTTETTKKALGLNFMFSFAGNITYPKNEYLREAIRVIPLDRIVIETDCPFLTPQAYRSKRNEPAYIAEVLKCIVEIKGLTTSVAEEIIYQNTLKLFKLPA